MNCVQFLLLMVYDNYFQNNVGGTNQQNYVGNMVDYSQGFSATNYFKVIGLIIFF